MSAVIAPENEEAAAERQGAAGKVIDARAALIADVDRDRIRGIAAAGRDNDVAASLRHGARTAEIPHLQGSAEVNRSAANVERTFVRRVDEVEPGGLRSACPDREVVHLGIAAALTHRAANEKSLAATDRRTIDRQDAGS